MSARPNDEYLNELVVSSELLAAAEQQGVHLHAGDRVRLEVIQSEGAEHPRQRHLPWLGAIATGKGDLGARAKEIVRDEMGRSAS